MTFLFGLYEWWTGPTHKWFAEAIAGPFANYVTILTAIPIAVSLWSLTFGARRRHRRWFERARTGQAAGMASILIVDLTKSDIRTQVTAFAAATSPLAEIPHERVFVVDRRKDLTPADIPDLVRDLRTLLNEIVATGSSQVHLFYGGPVAFGPVIGGELKSFFNVTLYQRVAASGSYENWGPLRHKV